MRARTKKPLKGWRWLLWLVFACYAAYCALILCFIAVMSAYEKVEQGQEFALFWKPALYTGYYTGVGLDVVWNIAVGTPAFKELPKEALFTSRLQRHAEKPEGDWRGDRARWWCAELDVWDENHCRLRPR